MPDERDHGERAPGEVDVTGGVWIARFRNVAHRDEDHGGGDRQVDQEDQPPRHRRDQKPADERSQCGGHTAEPRPGADGAAALLLGERRLEDGEASRREQRAADTLQSRVLR